MTENPILRCFWLTCTSLALAALSLGGCASLAPGQGKKLPAGAQYVSLGSSFAAGAGIGPIRDGTPQRCGRTLNNYASLLAARLKLDLVDASCGGATSVHVLKGWDELPPQIDALSVQTRLVTITIGGNDLGYVGWLFASSCRSGVSLNPGPCRPASEPTQDAYARLETNLRAIAQAVRARAPKARLVFVQYVTLLSDQACAQETIAPADAVIAKRIAQGLADVTAKAARQSGALVLAADQLSRAHAPCAPAPWSNGLFADFPREQGAPWHPNAAGHQAIAAALAAMI